MSRRIGFLGSCVNELCGGIEGYFCVRCRHYVSHCLCGFNTGGCTCPDSSYWAGEGERRDMARRLREEGA